MLNIAARGSGKFGGLVDFSTEDNEWNCWSEDARDKTRFDERDRVENNDSNQFPIWVTRSDIPGTLNITFGNSTVWFIVEKISDTGLNATCLSDCNISRHKSGTSAKPVTQLKFNK